MVSFIHDGSEITTWMGHSFKTKSTKSKAKFLSVIATSFLNFKLQIIKLEENGVVCQLTKTAIFTATPMKKHI